MWLAWMSLTFANPVELEAPDKAVVQRAWAVDGRIVALVTTYGPSGWNADHHWMRWNAKGTLQGQAQAPSSRGLPSDDGRYLAAWTSGNDGERDWVVWTKDLEEIGAGNCKTLCMPEWQPSGEVLAVRTGGALHLFDAKRREHVTLEHPAAFRSQWAGDGSHICTPGAVYRPDGKRVGEIDFDAAGLEPDMFSLEGCGRGELVGYGIDRGARADGMSHGEAVEKGVAVPVRVDRRGTTRLSALDRSSLPTAEQRPYRVETRTRRGRQPIHPLGDGRAVWSDENGVWLGPE